MVLVVGATGQVGGMVCRLLRDGGAPVRALVRAGADPAKVDALRAAGVDIVIGDLRDAASLPPALAAVDAVISTASATGAPAADNGVHNVDGEGQAALIDAAKQAGVRHFVFVSYAGAIDIDIPLRDAKRGAERRLGESGIPFTILRPTPFMEIWLSPLVGFDPAGGSVVIFGAGEQRISYISAGDVARFCAAVVNNPAAHGRVLEIGGPAAVTPNEIIKTAELTLGRSIAVQRVPVEALRAQYEAALDPLQRTLAGLSLASAQDVTVDMTALLREFPIAMRSVREHIDQLIRTTQTVAGSPAKDTTAHG